MIKEYFYIEDENQIGPLTKEELVSKISPETLVWFEGLDNWKKASEIDEFINFKSVPPPIPKNILIKKKKIEVVVKKEKKDFITAKSEVIIAKEIKNITYIILISFGISLIVYLFKSASENRDYNRLLNKFNNHKYLEKKLYEDKEIDFLISDSTFIKRNEELYDEEQRKLGEVLDSLYNESKLLNCYQEKELGYNFQSTGIKIPDENLTIECIKNKISQVNRLAFHLSITTFIILSILLIVSRYTFRTVNWVKKRV